MGAAAGRAHTTAMLRIDPATEANTTLSDGFLLSEAWSRPALPLELHSEVFVALAQKLDTVLESLQIFFLSF